MLLLSALAMSVRREPCAGKQLTLGDQCRKPRGLRNSDRQQEHAARRHCARGAAPLGLRRTVAFIGAAKKTEGKQPVGAALAAPARRLACLRAAAASALAAAASRRANAKAVLNDVTSISSSGSCAARLERQLPHQVASASISSETTLAGDVGRTRNDTVLPADRGLSSSSIGTHRAEKDTADNIERSSSSSSDSSNPKSSANSGWSETCNVGPFLRREGQGNEGGASPTRVANSVVRLRWMFALTRRRGVMGSSLWAGGWGRASRAALATAAARAAAAASPSLL